MRRTACVPVSPAGVLSIIAAVSSLSCFVVVFNCRTAFAQQPVSPPVPNSPGVGPQAPPATAAPQQPDPAAASQTAGPAVTGPTDFTPAQRAYGLPKNPAEGSSLDRNISEPLTLERAVAIGLAYQNTIAIAQTQADAAHQRVIEARSTYYPQVTPTFSYESTLTPQPSFIPGTGYFETTTEVLVARQLIWDTGKREATVGSARRSAFAAEYNVGNTRQDAIVTITQDYYNVLRDRELVRVQRENVKNAETTRDVIKAEAQVGAAANSDVIQAEADLANARVTLLQAQSNLGVDQATLKNAMGIVTAKPLVLANSKAVSPADSPDTLGIDTYVKLAYANRLDIKQQQEIVNAQGYNVRIAKLNAGLQVQANVTEGYALSPSAGEERDFLVSISFPLFDGGLTRATVRENQADLETDRRTLDQLEQTIHLGIEQDYLTRELARQQVAAANIAVTAAQTGYDVALAKQQNQLVNIPEVINAEVQLVNAEVSQVQAIYDYYIADARLKRDIGTNDSSFLPRVPNAKPPIDLAGSR